MIDTICLDAGGTLVWPNWARVADALAAEGIAVDVALLTAADPRVRRSLDERHLIAASTDQNRGWSFFDNVLTMAGVELTPGAHRALSYLEEYQRTSTSGSTSPSSWCRRWRSCDGAATSSWSCLTPTEPCNGHFDEWGW